MNTVPTLTFDPSAKTGLAVDLPRLIAGRLLIQANSGGGKSRLLRQACEQLFGQVQIIVLDPEGEFASLRERFDYLLAGRDGDVAAHPKTAKQLARRLLELQASAIVDLYDLELKDRRRYVRLFLEELVNAPRKLWHPLIVVVDEAHVFCPQNGEAESAAAMISLCTLGRKRGFAAVFATQRISKLHKDAAAELLNKVIGRTGLDVDMQRAGDELGFDKATRIHLRDLEPGEFFAFGPAIARGVTRVRAGGILTTHPEPGQIAPPAPPAPAAVRKVLSQLAGLEHQAEEEARTVEDLQRQLAAARVEIRKLQRGVAPVAADDKAVARAVAEATRPLQQQIQQLERARAQALAQYQKVVGAHNSQVARYVSSVLDITGRLSALTAPGPLQFDDSTPVATPAAPQRPQPVLPTPRTPPAPRQTAAAGPIGTPEQRMLNALATYESFGQDQVERDAVAAMAGYKPGSGHVNNTVGRMTAAGLVSIPAPGTLCLTDEGRARAAALRVNDLAGVHAAWMALLNGPQQKILEVLLQDYPKPVERSELAERAGFQPGSGHVNNTIGSLTSLKAAEIPQRGYVVASKLLFPEGLK